MAKIKKLGLLSFAKFQAIIFLFLGLIAGILYSFGGAIYDLLSIGLNWGTALAFFTVLGMPLIFAVLGFVFGLIEGIIFNSTCGFNSPTLASFEQIYFRCIPLCLCRRYLYGAAELLILFAKFWDGLNLDIQTKPDS